MGRRNKRDRRAHDAARIAAWDADLIRDCVSYAQGMAAVRAGHEVDPDPDGRHADELEGLFRERSVEALSRLSLMPAATALGLQAKARIVPVLLAHSNGVLEAAEEAFLKRFAADVRGQLQSHIKTARSAVDSWAP